MQSAFAKLNPTDKHTIKPGPAVADIAFISFNFTLLFFRAFLVIISIFSK